VCLDTFGARISMLHELNEGGAKRWGPAADQVQRVLGRATAVVETQNLNRTMEASQARSTLEGWLG
jgi:hypothetical protein